MKLLFVCSGNICRSPMAMGYMIKYFEDRSIINISVDSAGLIALDGMPPSPEAIKVAEENGFDISCVRSKGLKQEDIDSAYIILVMTDNQRDNIIELFSVNDNKVHLLKSYSVDGALSSEIFDPIGMDIVQYRRCFNIIKRSVEGLYKSLVLDGKIE